MKSTSRLACLVVVVLVAILLLAPSSDALPNEPGGCDSPNPLGFTHLEEVVGGGPLSDYGLVVRIGGVALDHRIPFTATAGTELTIEVVSTIDGNTFRGHLFKIYKDGVDTVNYLTTDESDGNSRTTSLCHVQGAGGFGHTGNGDKTSASGFLTLDEPMDGLTLEVTIVIYNGIDTPGSEWYSSAFAITAASDGSVIPETVAPAVAVDPPTDSPVTAEPTTSAPVTPSPTAPPTDAPITLPPPTDAPVAPVTFAPVVSPTQNPVTVAPVFSPVFSPVISPSSAPVVAPSPAPVVAPIPFAPLTPPITAAPVTAAPVTVTTLAPVTDVPVIAPITLSPVTMAPIITTIAPVTMAPVTLVPATVAPASNAPVSKAPTSTAPVSKAPTVPTPVPTEAFVFPPSSGAYRVTYAAVVVAASSLLSWILA